MSKYSIAKEKLEQAVEAGVSARLDEHEVVEALIVLSIQSLVEARGAKDVRQFVQYQLDSLAADGFHEIQRPGFG